MVMAQRRSPHRVSRPPSSSTLSRRKYSLRHSAAKRALAFVNRLQRSTVHSHASGASSQSSEDTATPRRPILAPLHPNLRRLPSRQRFSNKEGMRSVSNETVGSKRKRVPSANENGHASGRSRRGSGQMKRHKLSEEPHSDEESVASSMDVDSSKWTASDLSDDAASDEEGSSDEFYINEASEKTLFRLRKDELVRLYQAAGLSDDPDPLTKQDLVQEIIAARDDLASLPPSSPPAKGDASDYSSDDGNTADVSDYNNRQRPGTQNGLRRRATLNVLANGQPKHLTARSASTGQLHPYPDVDESDVFSNPKQVDGDTFPRRRNARSSSSRSSPGLSSCNTASSSPPTTRLRTRKVSAEQTASQATPGKGKGKGKTKQVEFAENVQTHEPGPSGSESELTDLDVLEDKMTGPSPRRLRSRDKGKASSSKMSDLEVPEDAEATPKPRVRTRSASAEEDLSDSQDDEEEVDELVSSPSPTPPPQDIRRTPVRRRLRPRRTQSHAAVDGGEGDDEEEEEDELEEGSVITEEEDEGDESEETVEGEEDGTYEESGSKVPVSVTPRKLRSGRVVGEGEDAEEDMEEAEEEAEEEIADEDVDEDEEVENVDEADEDVDLDAEAEHEDAEALEDDDIDLTVATAKTLVRLRRDDLVRLCESRDLDVDGTKPQLARSLLQWRDRHTSEFSLSSPSSTGTARPPSTVRARKRRTRSGSRDTTPPVLMRSDRVHLDEPRTPENNKETEPELELDLESLGLDDREIPYDKLTKLEKIGSGGFKDVFIGKFKGRKVALAEFRDQLSSMDIKELKLLGGFDHPNIVRFLGVSIPENTKETPVMIVSELCANGDLFDYVRNVPPPTLYKVLSIMLDIARGLEYLHMRKPSIIHRDCKSSNILITSKGVAKIADFGLAKVKQSTRSMVRSVVGTVNWQAPELWHAHPKYNHKVDVFSCAMVFWEMLQWHISAKKFPWEGMNEHAIYEAVGAKRQRPSIAGLRKQWCPEIVDLVDRMWAQDAQDRPTMSEVVQELEHLVTEYRTR